MISARLWQAFACRAWVAGRERKREFKVLGCPSTVRMVSLAVVVVLASTLAGCGRRDQLEPAPDPSVQAAKPADNNQVMAQRPRRVPIKPPQQPFVLDPLL
jgi:predicted small lipoprotein YifL